MSDKTELKKSIYLFHQESNRLLNSSWEDSPLPIHRFLQRCEADDIVSAYLQECIQHHLPEGFDAVCEYDEVLHGQGDIFGPFSTVPEEESAQVYLILKEVVRRNTKGTSNLFFAYRSGSTKFANMYKGFLDNVARRLIGNIEQYLTVRGFEGGLDDGPSVSFNGPVNNAQINQASGDSTVFATQSNGLQSTDLEPLIQAVLDAAVKEISDIEALSDIQDNVEELRSQMLAGKPKRGVLKGILSFLGGVNGGVQFAAAVADLANFLTDSGLISF